MAWQASMCELTAPDGFTAAKIAEDKAPRRHKKDPASLHVEEGSPKYMGAPGL